MTTLLADTFARANQSGWGTASDGHTWAAQDANATYSIATNEGVATQTGASANTLLGTGVTFADSDTTWRFACSAPSTDGVFALLRWVDANDCYYIGFVQNQVAIRKLVASSTTTIASAAFSATANTAYWCRVRVQGTSLFVKVWADGASEPSAWTASGTDSAFSAAGPFGLRTYGASGQTVSVDSLTVSTAILSPAGAPSAGVGGAQAPAALRTAALSAGIGGARGRLIALQAPPPAGISIAVAVGGNGGAPSGVSVSVTATSSAPSGVSVSVQE